MSRIRRLRPPRILAPRSEPRTDFPVPVLFVVVAAVVAFWLGLWGFDEYYGASRSFGDKLYNTIQLFGYEFAPQPPIPWQLQVARVLAAATTASAALLAIGALFRQQLAELRTRFGASGHVIVCGLGPCGETLAHGFQQARRERGEDGVVAIETGRVVAIESSEDNPAVEECRAAGITVLIGDARKTRVLAKARLKKSRYLIAACGDDGIDAEIATRVRELVREPEQLRERQDSGLPLDCFVLLDDIELCRRLEEVEAADPDDPLWLHFFNPSESAAPIMLVGDPALEPDAGAKDKPLHMLVVGAHQMGSRIVSHAARCWKLIPELHAQRLKVTILDKEPVARIASLRQRHPWLDDVDGLELVPCMCDVDEAGFDSGRIESAESGGGQLLLKDLEPTSVYVCLDTDERGLKAALALQRHLRETKPRIFVRTAERAGLATLLRGQEAGDPRAFGLVGRTCTPRMLLNPNNDLLAQVLHEWYLRRERQKGRRLGSEPVMQEWAELDEYFQESNRARAEHIGQELRERGYYIERLGDPGAEIVSFDDGEVEAMAEIEHERWRREREDEGWKTGDERDYEKRENPDLVPWSELPSDDRRDPARMTVREIPASLVRAELFAVRGDYHELIAKAVHEDYLRGRLNDGEQLGDRPALAEWAGLPDRFKDSSRAQARDIEVKLDAVGCEVVSLVSRLPGLIAFRRREVERMAEMEHARWCEERAGDDHPDLVPWSRLSEKRRDIDRDAVRRIPMLLDRVGFAVSRKRP